MYGTDRATSSACRTLSSESAIGHCFWWDLRARSGARRSELFGLDLELLDEKSGPLFRAIDRHGHIRHVAVPTLATPWKPPTPRSERPEGTFLASRFLKVADGYTRAASPEGVGLPR